MSSLSPSRVGGARLIFALGLLMVLGSALAACSSAPAATTRPVTTGPDASCSGVSGTHHVRVVVEVSRTKIVSNCVGFSTTSLSAIKALHGSHIAFGTQHYSTGVAICSADGVPAHYSQCFSSTGPYWALFISRNGAPWRAASVGLSEIALRSGDSIGVRYDSQSGTAAKPPTPVRA